MQFLRDLVQLRRSLRDLADAGDQMDRNASYELTASARRFSRRATRVVDDKLSFSATLMRAGEVDAAHRLLAEVESDVRQEQTALLDRVNEVSLGRTMQRERVTRLRLARTLAVAMLGASMLAFSAMGMAVAGFLQDRAQEGRTVAASAAAAESARKDARESARRNLPERLKKVRIAGRSVILTERELLVYRQLATGALSGSDAAQLLSLLPPELAARVRRLVGAVEAARKATPEAPVIVIRPAEKQKKKKAAEAKPKPAEKPSPQPSQGGQGEPSPSESPSSPPDDDDSDAPEDRDGGSGPLGLGDVQAV